MLGKVVVTHANAVKVLVGANKFEVMQQQAVLHTSDGQVRKFTLSLAQGEAPYPVGEYTISDESLQVTQYGGLELARNIKLVPLKAGDLRKTA